MCNLCVCVVSVHACVHLSEDAHTCLRCEEAMASSSLFARSGFRTRKSLCLCVSVSYVHQSKVTVLADARGPPEQH